MYNGKTMRARSFIAAGLFIILLTSCTDKQTKKEIRQHAAASEIQTYINQIKKERESVLERYVEEMPLEQKIAQLFIENLEGCIAFRSYETVGAMNGTADDTPLIAGGYIFFSYNTLYF